MYDVMDVDNGEWTNPVLNTHSEPLQARLSFEFIIKVLQSCEERKEIQNEIKKMFTA